MEEVKSYAQMRKEFMEKYYKFIVPCVQQYEQERKLKLVLAIIGSTVCLVLGIFLLMHADDKSSREATVAVLCLSYFVWYWIKKGFENKVKSDIMPAVCKCFGDMQWSNGSYADSAIFADSLLVPYWSGSSYDDVFKGSYKGVGMEIIEAQYTVGTGKNKRTVFDGVIVKLDMNKKFKCHTVIKSDSWVHVSPSSRLRHTTLEDVVFEKKFDVFTDDEVEARYLLTPSFMERLNNIKTAFKADKISCAFYGKDLLIGLHTNIDIFSICSLTKPVDDLSQYVTMYGEIVSIIKLIDHFKLDQKIGL